MMFSDLHTWRQSIRSRMSRRAAQTRRKALHQQLGSLHVAARVEQLEDRILLSVSTPVLGSSNDVVFNGDGGADEITFRVNSDGLLRHSLGGSFNSVFDLDSVTPGDQTRSISDITSLSYNDSGTNDNVEFGGSNVFALASADLSVGAGTIIIDSDVSLTAGDGAISLTADRNIVLESGSSLTTVDGGASGYRSYRRGYLRRGHR